LEAAVVAVAVQLTLLAVAVQVDRLSFVISK
jgi:hypothetical protein